MRGTNEGGERRGPCASTCISGPRTSGPPSRPTSAAGSPRRPSRSLRCGSTTRWVAPSSRTSPRSPSTTRRAPSGPCSKSTPRRSRPSPGPTPSSSSVRGRVAKTRVLLDAMVGAGELERYLPFDVSDEFLREAAGELRADYPGIDIHAVVGDFHRHLDRIPRKGRRLIAFLGGTMGLHPRGAPALLLRPQHDHGPR